MPLSVQRLNETRKVEKKCPIEFLITVTLTKRGEHIAFSCRLFRDDFLHEGRCMGESLTAQAHTSQVKSGQGCDEIGRYD